MIFEVKIPRVGESITEVTIGQWLKTDGEYMQMDEVICEIESEKATLEIRREKEGILKIIEKEGETVSIGHKIAEIDTTAQKPDKLSTEEQKEKTPSGKQLRYYNRVAWAITYLKMGELIESPERGKYHISDLGKKIINNPPEKITISFLKTLPNFEKNRNPNKEKVDLPEIDEDDISDKTPD